MRKYDEPRWMRSPSLRRLSAGIALVPALLFTPEVSAELPDGILFFFAAPGARVSSLNQLEYRTYASVEEFSQRGLTFLGDDSFNSGPYMEVQGMATIGDELYGVERDPNTGSSYLTKADPGNLFVRIAAGPAIGVPEVEALVWNGHKLVAAGRGPQPNTTTLIELSPTTGQATALAIPPLQAQLVGLAYDSSADVIYGVSIPDSRFGGSAVLYRVDIDDGSLAIIGRLERAFRGLTWVDTLGLVGAAERFFMIGTTDASIVPLVSGPDLFFEPDRGVNALATKGTYLLEPAPIANPAESHTQELGAQAHSLLPSLAVDEEAVNLAWTSKLGESFFVLEYSPDLNFWNWKILPGVPPSSNAGMNLQYEHLPDPFLRKGFYQLYELEATASTDPVRMLGACGLVGLAALGAMTLRKTT